MLINRKLKKLAEIKATAGAVRSSGFERSCNPNRATEAAFVRDIERAWELEQEIDIDVDRLVSLKRQLLAVIPSVPDVKGQQILFAHYVKGKNWCKIGREMGIDRTTAMRQCDKALEQVQMPENPREIS